MKRFIRPCAVATTALAMALTSWSVRALSFSDFVIFGTQEADLGGGNDLNGGMVGSNNTVIIGNNVSQIIVTGGGMLSAGGGGDIVDTVDFVGDVDLGNNVQVVGNVVSNGNVSLGGSVEVLKNAGVGGNVHAGGTVSIGNNSTIEGDVLAGSNLTTGNGAASIGANVDIGGDLGANGKITIGNGTSVTGNIIQPAGSTLTLGAGVTHGGQVVGNVTPTAASFTAVNDLPAAATVNAEPTAAGDLSTANNTNHVVGPGQYRNYEFNGGNTIAFSSGRYDFNTLKLGNNATLNLDLTNGPIEFYAATEFDFGGGLTVNLIGGGADQVYWESLGDFLMGNNAAFAGTVYTPQGMIDIGGGLDASGAFYAGGIATGAGIVDIGNNAKINHTVAWKFLPQNTNGGPTPTNGTGGGNQLEGGALPEPATAGLLALGIAGLLTGATRRRAA